MVDVFPVLLHIPWLPGKIFQGQKAFMTVLDELIMKHKMTRDPTQPPRGLTDTFLDKVEEVSPGMEPRCVGCATR